MKSFPTIRSQPGFTLVELLLVMAIIAVLASLSLAVIGDAQYDAQANATQSRINQISSVLEETLEEYSVQRLRIQNIENFIDPAVANDKVRALARQTTRRIMTDVINFEMPRSYNSIALNNNSPGNNQVQRFPSREFQQWFNDQIFFQEFGGQTLIEELQQNVTFKSDRFRIPDADASFYPDANESDMTRPSAIIRTSSEYLYGILQHTESQGILAIESLSQRSFADTDGDGFLEVVDSWGNPIGFFFEMYDDDGKLLDPNLLPNPNGSLTVDLDAGFQQTDDVQPLADAIYPTAHFGIPARNLQIRIYSTGNKSVDDFGEVTTFAQWRTLMALTETLVTN